MIAILLSYFCFVDFLVVPATISWNCESSELQPMFGEMYSMMRAARKLGWTLCMTVMYACKLTVDDGLEINFFL